MSEFLTFVLIILNPFILVQSGGPSSDIGIGVELGCSYPSSGSYSPELPSSDRFDDESTIQSETYYGQTLEKEKPQYVKDNLDGRDDDIANIGDDNQHVPETDGDQQTNGGAQAGGAVQDDFGEEKRTDVNDNERVNAGEPGGGFIDGFPVDILPPMEDDPENMQDGEEKNPFIDDEIKQAGGGVFAGGTGGATGGGAAGGGVDNGAEPDVEPPIFNDKIPKNNKTKKSYKNSRRKAEKY